MLDLKSLKAALEQLEAERKIPREKILDAIEQALAAAYKKDYGKRGQIIRARLDLDTGKTEFYQVKIVVDESVVRLDAPSDDEAASGEYLLKDEDERPRWNPEHHILLEDARRIKKDATLHDEITFPLEGKDDYGRIAAQTAKQVIIQKIREAERVAVLDEYGGKEGEIVSGVVQKIERGNVYVDFARATGVMTFEEQIPGEYLEKGQRVRSYLYSVEDAPRGVGLRLSRTHPEFLKKLFAAEAPEIENGVVEIKVVAREPGSRSKIAVFSHDEHIDPVGSCVGQRGTRVNTVSAELSGEKIDIIPWSEDPAKFIGSALSPAKANSVALDPDARRAVVEVDESELSLAIGKGGQNVRLAAKLTGWKIDIKGGGEIISADSTPEENLENGEQGNEIAQATETEAEVENEPA